MRTDGGGVPVVPRPLAVAVASDAIDRLRGYLVDGPLSLDDTQVDRLRNDLVTRLQDTAPSPFSGATTALQAAASVVLALALLFLLLKDGRGMWQWLVGLFPPPCGSVSTRPAGRAGTR